MEIISTLIEVITQGSQKEVEDLFKVNAMKSADFSNIALRTAVIEKQYEIAKWLLEDPSVRKNASVRNNMIFMHSMKNGWLDIVDDLLTLPEVNDKLNANCNNAVQCAVESGHIDIVKKILSNEKRKNNLTFNNVRTMLADCLWHGKLDMIRFFLQIEEIQQMIVLYPYVIIDHIGHINYDEMKHIFLNVDGLHEKLTLLEKTKKEVKPQAMQEKFIQLAREHNTAEIKKLIKAGWNINVSSEVNNSGKKFSLSALEVLAREKNEQGMLCLLQCSERMSVFSDEIIDSVLHLAANEGTIFIVKMLCQYGAEISLSIIEDAARCGHIEIVKFILEKYPEFIDTIFEFDKERDKSNHGSVLHAAIQGGHLEIIKFLLDKGMDLQQIESENSPVSLAARTQDFEILQLLIQRGAPVDRNALSLAAKKGDLEAVIYLLSLGLQVDEAPKGKNSPLIAAASSYRDTIAVMEYLLDHGADLEKRVENIRCENEADMTPLLMAAYWGCHDQLKLLLARGADQFALNAKKETVLIAVAYGAEEYHDGHFHSCVAILESLSYKEKQEVLDHQNEEGKTALQVAKERNLPEIITLLEDQLLERNEPVIREWCLNWLLASPLNKSRGTTILENLLQNISFDLDKAEILYTEEGHYVLTIEEKEVTNLSLLLKNSDLTQFELSKKLVKKIGSFLQEKIPKYDELYDKRDFINIFDAFPTEYQKQACSIYTGFCYKNINNFFRAEPFNFLPKYSFFEEHDRHKEFLVCFLFGCILIDAINKLNSIPDSVKSQENYFAISQQRELDRGEKLTVQNIHARLGNPWTLPALTSFSIKKNGSDFFQKKGTVRTKLRQSRRSYVINYSEGEVLFSPGEQIISTLDNNGTLYADMVCSPVLEVKYHYLSDMALLEAFKHYLSKEYAEEKSELQINGNKIYRPNHNITHVYRVILSIDLVIDYFTAHAKDEAFREFCENIKEDEKEFLRIAAAFSVTGRESEISAGEDLPRYQKYREASAQHVKMFLEKECVYTKNEDQKRIEDIVRYMGNPDYENKINQISDPNERQIRNFYYRILTISHKLDLPRCYSAKKFLESIQYCLTLSMQSKEQIEDLFHIIRYVTSLIKIHGGMLHCDVRNQNIENVNHPYQEGYLQTSTSMACLFERSRMVTKPTLNPYLSPSFQFFMKKYLLWSKRNQWNDIMHYGNAILEKVTLEEQQKGSVYNAIATAGLVLGEPLLNKAESQKDDKKRDADIFLGKTYLDAAESCGKKSFKILESINSKISLIKGGIVLAEIYIAQKKYELAKEELKKAKKTYQANVLQEPILLTNIYLLMGKIERAISDEFKKEKTYCLKAFYQCKPIQATGIMLQIVQDLMLRSIKLNDYDYEEKFLQEASSIEKNVPKTFASCMSGYYEIKRKFCHNQTVKAGNCKIEKHNSCY